MSRRRPTPIVPFRLVSGAGPTRSPEGQRAHDLLDDFAHDPYTVRVILDLLEGLRIATIAGASNGAHAPDDDPQDG